MPLSLKARSSWASQRTLQSDRRPNCHQDDSGEPSWTHRGLLWKWTYPRVHTLILLNHSKLFESSLSRWRNRVEVNETSRLPQANCQFCLWRLSMSHRLSWPTCFWCRHLSAGFVLQSQNRRVWECAFSQAHSDYQFCTAKTSERQATADRLCQRWNYRPNHWTQDIEYKAQKYSCTSSLSTDLRPWSTIAWNFPAGQCSWICSCNWYSSCEVQSVFHRGWMDSIWNHHPQAWEPIAPSHRQDPRFLPRASTIPKLGVWSCRTLAFFARLSGHFSGTAPSWCTWYFAPRYLLSIL